MIYQDKYKRLKQFICVLIILSMVITNLPTTALTARAEDTNLPAEQSSTEKSIDQNIGTTEGDNTAETGQKSETEKKAVTSTEILPNQAGQPSEKKDNATTEATKDPFAKKEEQTSPTATEKKETTTPTAPTGETRILVGTDNPRIIRKEDKVLSSYDNIYYLSFPTEKAAKDAYSYYNNKADFVDWDIEFKAAEEKAVEVTSEDNQDDPIAALNTALEEKTQGTEKYDIAVIDTGCDPSIKNVKGISLIGEDPKDDNGHGSRMIQEILGQNNKASVLSIKALNKDGAGNASDIYAAIQYAVEKKVKIINLSLSSYSKEESQTVTTAIQDAVKAGIVVVGAAGNNGKDAKYFVPGKIEEAVIVGSCDSNGQKLNNSNYGNSIDYYITSESTSNATAIMSGWISARRNWKNDLKDYINKGLIFAPNYQGQKEEANIKEEDASSCDFAEKGRVKAADVQGAVSENREDAISILKMEEGLTEKAALRTADSIFRIAEDGNNPQPVLIDGIPRSGDGSNIESIIAKWITADTVDNGDASFLYVKPDSDEKQMVVLQINYALSGEHNYEPGDIVITVPKNIFKTRAGKEAGYMLIPYAEDPSTKNDFNWKEVGDNYVLTNTKRMSAATKGYIQFGFMDLVPHELVDMKVSDDFKATIEVFTHAGNTIGLGSNSLRAQFDTEAKVTNVIKKVSEGPEAVSANEIPEGQRIPGENEYIKIDWYVRGEIKSNTMYTLNATDTMPNEYRGFIINGSERLVDEGEKYHGHSGGDTAYYYYSTAYPMSEFQAGEEYTFHNNIKFVVLEDDPAAEVINPNVGEDPRLRTEAENSAIAHYSYEIPEWKDPTGHFMVVKNGNDDTEGNNNTHKSYNTESDLHLWSRSPYGWYGIYPSGINDLQDEYATNGENGGIRLAYTVNSIGYVMPWMFDSDSYNVDHEMAARRSVNYTRPVSITTTDKGISLIRDGNKMTVGKDYEYEEIEFPETPWVYRGVPHNINPDGSWKAVTAGDGTFEYSKDPDVKNIPDIVLEFQDANGSWNEYATASWKTGHRVVTLKSGSVDGDARVPVPAGTKGFRTKVVMQNTSTDTQANEALQAAIDYDVRVVVKLHSTKKLNNMIDVLFDKSNTPQFSIWNEAEMIGEREDVPKEDNNRQIVYLDNDGYDSVRGYTTDTAVYPHKSSTQTLTDVDYENQRLTIHYNADVEEKSLIYDRQTYEKAVKEGRLKEETGGYWRDLLPRGVTPVMNSIRLRSGDSIVDSYTIENYKGSGRTLLVVDAELKNTPVAVKNGDSVIYEDKPSIAFDATYDFDAMTDYGKQLHNVISFESKNDFIGTTDHYSGEPDDPRAGKNVSSDDAFENEREMDIMTNLNPSHDNPSFVYAGTTTVVDIISAARTSLTKDVMTNNDGWWSDGLYYNNPEGNKRTVWEGGQYAYRLRMMSDAETISKDLILYDSLENFYAGSGNDIIDIDAPRWQGTFRSVDVSQLEKMGCAPVVYYSTVENLQLSNETNPNQAHATNTKLEAPIWIKASDYQGSLADVKAVAVDASKRPDGTDFVLNQKESVVVLIQMRAPSGEDARRYISQKGIWGDSAHAYNNIYMLCTSIDATTMQEDSDNFVRKDYTKIGLLETEIDVEKTWDDEDNRDGKRPESVTLHLYADGEDTGQSVTLPQQVEDPGTGELVPSWKAAFHNIPYTDPDGNKINYSIREDAVEGYSASVVEDDNHYTVKNVHNPEKVEISGEKTWKNDSPENRPSYIVVSLLANGKEIMKKTVSPNAMGKWLYEFKDLYKYENGQEINYTIKETSDKEEIKSYISSTDGYNIINTYHPYGDLVVNKEVVHATPAAAEKQFTFNFEFTKGENPIFKSYDYDILQGENIISSGQVATNGKIAIKGGQSIHVKEIDQGVSYKVTEDEREAFTLTNSENTSGVIKPNETATATFENTYKASGKISFEASKKLLNREMVRNNFFFDVYLVGENGTETVVKSAANTRPTEVVMDASGKTVDYSVAPVSFGAIRYTEEDAGKTYTYKIRERDRGWDYMTFDNKEYTVEVTVTDPNGDGNLVVTPVYKYQNQTITADNVKFENEYRAEGSTDFKAWKNLSGRDLKAKEFTFNLYDEDGNVIQRKKNGVGGMEPATVTKYSHTPNVSDDGTKNGNYANNANQNEVITIDGAEHLTVRISFGGESASWDWACVWKGNHPNYTAASHYPGSISGKLGGGNHTDASNTKTYEINGDTVTFGFKSDSSGCGLDGYGYYAVISGETLVETEGDDTSLVQFDPLNFTQEDIGKTLYYTAKETIPDSAVPYTRNQGTITKANSNLTYGTASAEERKQYLWGDASYNSSTKTGGVIYDQTEHVYAITVKDNGNGTLSFDQEMVIGPVRSWELYKVTDGQETPVIDPSTNATKIITNEANHLPVLAEEMNLEDGTYRLKEVMESNSALTARTIEYELNTDDDIFTAKVTNGTLPAFNNKLEPGKISVSKGVMNGDENKEFRFKIKLYNPDEDALSGAIHYKSEEANFSATIDKEKWQNVVKFRSPATSFRQASGVSASDVLGKPGVVKVDDGTTDYSVYMWTEDNTTYWWSDAPTVYLPNDSSRLFMDCNKLTSIDISGFDTSKVTNMSSMFNGCKNLTSLDVSGLDTSNVEYMNSMFSYCQSLTSLDLSNFDTAKVTNMASMFYNCNKLTNLNISNFDTSNVIDMGNMFGGCHALTSLDVSGFDTSKVTDMSFMFSECKTLTSLDLSGFDTSKVTNMEVMFNNCNALSILDVSGFDTSNVTTMEKMFSGCKGLTSLDVSGFDTGNVTDMHNMFYGCNTLTNLDISGFDTGNVTDMRYMFSYCQSLPSLDVSGFDTSNVTNMKSMFNNCKALTNLDVSKFDTSKVTDMSYMFYSCLNLTSLDVSDFDTSKVTDMSYMFSDCKALTSLDVSGFDTSNVTNINSIFSNCKALTNLDVSSFDTSKVTNMSYMFSYCQSLPSLDVSGFDTSNVTNMASMFNNCKGLTSLDVSGFDTSKVTDMNYMFSNCQNLTSLNLSGFDTSNVTNMADMFSDCTGLTSLDVSGFNTSKVTNMSSMFQNCSNLTSLDVSGFDTGKVTNMNAMFSKCNNLIRLNISNFNTSNVTDMNGMFEACNSLTSLNVSGFDTSKVTDMNNMFLGCTHLTDINISNFNTSNVTRMNSMFYNCKALNNLNLTNFNTSKVTNMSSMFYNCSNLTILDLSSFDTRNATTMSYMFSYCENLANIHVSDLWNTDKVTDSRGMFTNDTNLPNFNASVVDKTNAHYNTGGYLTYKAAPTGALNNGRLKANTSNNLFKASKKNRVKDNVLTGLADLFGVVEVKAAVVNSGTNGTCSWEIDDQGVLRVFPTNGVSGTLADSSGNGPWYSYRTQIKKVVVDPRVSAGALCYGLFRDFSNCTEMDLSNLDTSNVTRMNNMFSGCRGLTSLDVSGFDTDNVTDMSYMFYNCNALTSLDISGFDTGNVTDMQSMFRYCTALTDLDVSGFDTSNVTSMSYMFSSCSGLTSLDISGWDTGNVTNMSSMFADCKDLTSLDVSGFDTSNVTNMADMFNTCNNLTSLDVSGFDTSNVTNMASMFNTCNNLTSLDVSGFDTQNVTDMSYMFKDCNKLTSLDVSGFDTQNVTNMGNMFRNCKALTSLDVSGFDTDNVTDMNSMFRGCSGLTSLDVSGFDTQNVTNMKNMFYNCNALTSLDVSGWNTSNVTNMNNMFYGCRGLTNLNVSDWDTGNVTDMSSMFRGCSSLTSLNISGFDTSKVTNMDSMFSASNKLSTINLGENFSFNGNNITSTTRKALLPTPSDSGYTGKWIREDEAYGPFTPEELRDNYTPAMHGKWIWQERTTKYTVNFTAPDASGSMASQKFTANESTTLPEGTFIKKGYIFDHWYDADKDVHYNDNTIPANTYQVGDNVTLTAIFVPNEGYTDASDNEIEFTLRAGETMTFDDIPAGTSYQVFEETEDGWVLASSTGDSGTVEPQQNSSAIFINDYQPGTTSIQLNGVKYLDEVPAEAGKYTFVLYEGTTRLQEKTNGGAGMIAFDPITYTEAGTHTYTIMESVGDDEKIDYDRHMETVTVNVTDNGDGTLTANATYDSDGVVYNNTTIKKTLTIRKTGNGVTNANRNDIFTFKVTIDGKEQEVSCKANETVTIPDIPAGAAYHVEEINLPKGWTFSEAENEDGTISLSGDNEVTITNDYSATGKIELSAYKTLDKGSADEGEYSFQLLDAQDQVIETVSNKKAQIDGKALIRFSPLEYDLSDIGAHTYKIREVEGSDNRINYDSRVIPVTVTVADAGNGKLNVTESSNEDDRVFNNTHKPASLKVTKSVMDVPQGKENVEFTFHVELDDKEHSYTGVRCKNSGELVSAVTISDGNTFKLKADEYILVENLPDDMAYTITEEPITNWEIESSTNTTGKLVGGSQTEVSFVNTYNETRSLEGQAQIVAVKNFNFGNITEDDDLSFTLMDEERNVLQQKTVDQTGDLSSTITFDPLFYSSADVGKTFTYYVREEEGTSDYIIYDTREYEVEVTVTDLGTGTLATDVAYVTRDGENKTLHHEPMEFNNQRAGSLELRKILRKKGGDVIDGSQLFEFTVTLSDPNDPTHVYTGGLFENNVAVVRILGNNSVLLTGIPAGMNYSIVEAPITNYELTSSENATGVIVAGETQVARFSNDVDVQYADLTIEKEVNGGEINKEFDFTLHLEGDYIDSEISYTKTTAAGTTNGTVATASDIPFKLAHGQSIVFKDIPKGATYSIVEAETDGYQVTSTNSSGTLTDDTTATFINNQPANGKLSIVKVPLQVIGAMISSFKVKIWTEDINHVKTPVAGYKIADSDLITDEEGSFTYNINTTGNTSNSISWNLPAGWHYSVEETAINRNDVEFARVYHYGSSMNGNYSKAPVYSGQIEQPSTQTVFYNVGSIPVKIRKKNGANEYLPGAHLQILDDEGTVLKDWTSGDSEETIKLIPNLPGSPKLASAYYVLHEVSAPAGYQPAEDIKFTVNPTDNTVYMENQYAPTYPIKLTDNVINLYNSNGSEHSLNVQKILKKDYGTFTITPKDDVLYCFKIDLDNIPIQYYNTGVPFTLSHSIKILTYHNHEYKEVSDLKRATFGNNSLNYPASINSDGSTFKLSLHVYVSPDEEFTLSGIQDGITYSVEEVQNLGNSPSAAYEAPVYEGCAGTITGNNAEAKVTNAVKTITKTYSKKVIGYYDGQTFYNYITLNPPSYLKDVNYTFKDMQGTEYHAVGNNVNNRKSMLIPFNPEHGFTVTMPYDTAYMQEEMVRKEEYLNNTSITDQTIINEFLAGAQESYPYVSTYLSYWHSMKKYYNKNVDGSLRQPAPDMSGPAVINKNVVYRNQSYMLPIYKQIEGGGLLGGARMQIVDKATNEVLKEWTSSATKPFVLALERDNLRLNYPYVLREVSAPSGYQKAPDIEFSLVLTPYTYTGLDGTQTGKALSFHVGEENLSELRMTDPRVTNGSIKVIKMGKNRTPLKGVTFKLTNNDTVNMSLVTDDNGEITFNNVPAGEYYLTETDTVDGYTLLADPIKITLPYTISKAEAEEGNVDVTKAVYDAVEQKYLFYDLTYRVQNDVTLDMPMSGGLTKGVLLFGIVLGCSLILIALLRKKEDEEDAAC